MGAALRQPVVAQPTLSADSAARKSRTLAARLRGGYLHGEAWVGESLPLNAALRLGIPRLHAVLGVATDPFGPGTDFAWGVGLGTAWQTRSRFTPSLDVTQWFVTGDREGPTSRLTQLRPLLGWQLRPGSRWQLVGGPTLNLATAPRERGRPPRWHLGQEQWLWLDSESPRSLTRLWPGVQLGLRF